MSKLLKILGIGTALVGCGIAMGWWCDVCHTDHRGPLCPRYTTGYQEYRGCNDAYICADLLYDSEDETQFGKDALDSRDLDAAEATISAKRKHRNYSFQKVRNFIRNASLVELRKVRSATRSRAYDLNEDPNAYGCYDDVYGCQ